MLKLARLADYGLMIAAALVNLPEERLKLEQVAERTGLSVATVRKIMKLLVDGGVVSSERGIHGGYSLADAPENIPLARVVRAVEGGVSLTACCREDADCEVRSLCTVQNNWNVINQTVETLFHRISVLDMTRRLSHSDLIDRLRPDPLRLVSLEQ